MATFNISCPGASGVGTRVVGPDDIPGPFVLQNVGQCKLKVAMRDSDGSLFGAMEIGPGGQINYYVHDRAAELIAACWTDCRGTGALNVSKGTSV